MSRKENKSYYDENGNMFIKPYQLIDLAKIFDVNYRTFKRWVNNIEKELGKPSGRYYSVAQVEYMIAQFGLPRKLDSSTPQDELKKAA